MKIANAPDKNLCLKYGKLLMDFANADSTDEVIPKFFDNLHKTYSLSDDYLENANSKFPTLSSLMELPEESFLFVETMIKIAELTADINLYLRTKYDFNIMSIDIKENNIEIIKSGKFFLAPKRYMNFGYNDKYLKSYMIKRIIRNYGFGEIEFGYLEIPKKSLSKRENKSLIISFNDLISEKYFKLNNTLYNKVVELNEIIDKLNGHIVNIKKYDYDELNRLVKYWENVLVSHKLVDKFQKELNDIFSYIEKGLNIVSCDKIGRYLGIYNKFYSPNILINGKGEIKYYLTLVNEGSCVLNAIDNYIDPESLLKLLSHSLISFLGNINRNKIKRCPFCKKFFIARDVKRQRCYSKECQKEFEKLKKRKQREREPEVYS